MATPDSKQIGDHRDTVTNHTELVPEARQEAAETDKVSERYAADPGIEISEATNKRLFWKINRRILAIQLITYFCQSLDKGTLNFASIMGIKTDAHLSDYNWLGTILYIGILAGEYPQNYLLQKLPVAKILAVNVFCWGAVVACTAATVNFPSLMVVRFLLGLFESCVQPAMMLITSMWYTRAEQSLLNSFWYCMTGTQLMVGGLIAFGASHYSGALMYSWQLLFFVLGVTTVAWSFCIGIFLPDNPMAADCFSEEDRQLMIERVRANETGIQNKTYKMYQAIEALKDAFVWCCVLLILVANLVIGGLGVFSNLIIEAFGFTTLQTQLLNIAQGAITIMVMIGSAKTSQHWDQTCITMIIWTLPAMTGTIAILCVTPTASNAAGMLIAFYCTQFFLAQGNMIISLVTRNIAGQTKKVIAPQIFQSKDAPRYLHGFTAHIVIYVVYIALVVVTRILLMAKNRKKVEAIGGEDRVSHELAFLDLTDQYVLQSTLA
ncbi:hypothetical protein VMCG_06857 [Cytospora schulzeri]|uniref:Major facilitator superfamily (MFS) profile domain-containing protein n=1 Tax=Cytospora schulzeri TaxID=448051 RepID=A0A423W290_9PEZI|nr:hypothetical protein VMCG_06857 [Valsa malicola]